MKRLLQGIGVGIFSILFLFLSACHQRSEEKEKHASHEEEKKPEQADGHDHGSEAVGASYEEGKGITLLDETKKSLGLEIIEVMENPLQPMIHLNGQIYRIASESSKIYGQEKQGNAYATALISEEQARELKGGQKISVLLKNEKIQRVEGGVLKIDLTQVASLGKAEALLELPDPDQRWSLGSFIEIEVPLGTGPRPLLSIPHSAVLETSTGKYVFVQNGDFLLRTEIRTGLQSEALIEIVEGLYEGDAIVVKPVEALYMIELRSTKGGGHCH